MLFIILNTVDFFSQETFYWTEDSSIMVSESCRGGREHEDGITSLPIHCHLARFRVFDKKKLEKVTFKDGTWKHQKEQDIYKSQHDKSMEIS